MELFDPASVLRLLDGLYPRLLTQIDRDPDSPTYGSCDRLFWQYRIHDFDSGPLCQASLTFAALAALAEHGGLEGCDHLDEAHAVYWRRLAEAINLRNLELFGRNGRIDEYYPGDGSFPATAFVGYATTKSAAMLGQNAVLEHPRLEAVARYLLTRRPSPAANQDVAAAAFLALYSKTLNWRRDAAANVVAALTRQDDPAFRFDEYGGIDLGYLSVTLNYLAYIDRDESFDVGDALRRTAELLATFVTPGGRLGGEFATRSTTYVLPFGFLHASRLDPELAHRLGKIDLAGAFAKLDDRYLMHYCLPALARSVLDLAEQGAPRTAAPSDSGQWFRQHLDDAGLFVLRNDETAAFVALNKGGTLQIETGESVDIDCGYRLERDGAHYATCVVDDRPDSRVESDGPTTNIRVVARFQRYPTMVASPMKTIILRALLPFGSALSEYFKRVLIKDPRVLDDVVVERLIRLDPARRELVIEDQFLGSKESDRITVAPASSFRLVPSAKFHQAGEEAAFLRATGPARIRETRRRIVPLGTRER